MNRIVKSLRVLSILAGFGFVGLLVYAAFLECPPMDVYADETKCNMKIIAVAIREYREAQPKNQYPDLTADTWVTQLKKTPESKVLIEKLPESVWSIDRKTEFRDAWGNPIVFSSDTALPGGQTITSAGPDGDITTTGDNIIKPFGRKR
jgi:type II secretory pathway pseudopilin PulG